MSSLFATSPDPQEMPGFHYSRIMAYTADLPADKAAKVRESAQFLIGQIPAQDEIQQLRVQLDNLVTFLADHPQLFYAYPGEGYWPLSMLLDRLNDAGLFVRVPGYTVKNGGAA
jgi:hypothetical protein